MMRRLIPTISDVAKLRVLITSVDADLRKRIHGIISNVSGEVSIADYASLSTLRGKTWNLDLLMAVVDTNQEIEYFQHLEISEDTMVFLMCRSSDITLWQKEERIYRYVFVTPIHDPVDFETSVMRTVEAAIMYHALKSIPRTTTPAVKNQTSQDRVLVIESDIPSAELIQRMLESGGFDVKAASGILAGCRDIGQESFAAVVVSLNLDGLIGARAVKVIRDRLKSNDVPIIAIGTKITRALASDCLQFSAARVLAKPISREALVKTLRSLLASDNHADSSK